MRKEVEDRIVEGLRRIWPLVFILVVFYITVLILLFGDREEEYDMYVGEGP